MKSNILKIKPSYLKKVERTKSYIVIVTLGYMILHKLNKLEVSIKKIVKKSPFNTLVLHHYSKTNIFLSKGEKEIQH